MLRKLNPLSPTELADYRARIARGEFDSYARIPQSERAAMVQRSWAASTTWASAYGFICDLGERAEQHPITETALREAKVNHG